MALLVCCAPDFYELNRAPVREAELVATEVDIPTPAETSDAEKVEIIRQILSEPLPEWFQNSNRRANSYAERLLRIAEVVDGQPTRD